MYKRPNSDRDVNERPNIVLVMTDQHRAGFTAGDGFALDTMPFVDSLIAQGTRFRRGYTTSPACVPARSSLLTGRFPKAHRVRQNSAAEHVYRPRDMVDVLRDAGYRTHFAGKPHMYRDKADFDSYAGPYWHERGPGDGVDNGRHQGFEDWLVDLDHGVSQVATPYPLESQFPYRIVSDAMAAVDAGDQEKPFFTWLSFPEPHNPYQVPEPYFSMFSPDEVPERVGGPEDAALKGGAWRWLRTLQERKRPGYDAEWRRYRAVYCGMLRLIDDQVRRFVEHLETRGVAERTVFVFVSDHGDYVGDHGLQRKGAGMPECLMRIPYAVVGPGVVARDNTDDFVSLVDIFPTLCELLGQDIPYGVQGRSLAPLLAGADYPAQEFASIYAERGYGGLPYRSDELPELHFPYEGRTFDELNSVTQSGNSKMLRRGTWKLLYDSTGHGELYDLATDPGELVNRFRDPELQSLRADLVEELLQWTIRTDDDLPVAAYTPKRAPHNWFLTAGRDQSRLISESTFPQVPVRGAEEAKRR